jgi:predicted acetylornithine/succinylornithine family transaminase
MSSHQERAAGAAPEAAADTESLVGNYARFDVTFVRGEGASLWDSAGDEYLDFLCGLGVTSVGHCHPAVVDAITSQASSLVHVSNLFYTTPMTELAARLSARTLGGGVLFANSGAEANEAALKLARKRRRGGGFVVALRGFHGRTYGALSATPQEAKQAPFAPLVPGFVAAEPSDIATLVSADTAAVLIEPLQGEGGVHPIDPAVLQDIRRACDEHGALLIFDEVQTGMGRTGTLFAHEQLGVTPDAMTVAKGLAGGLPIGALICSPAVSDVYQPGDHGSTFAGGPVQCAAALATLGVLDTPELLARVRELGERLREGLAELPFVSSVRGMGLMVAAEVDVDAPALVKRALLEQRLIVNATGPTTLRLLPPLIIDESHVDDALQRLRALA